MLLTACASPEEDWPLGGGSGGTEAEDDTAAEDSGGGSSDDTGGEDTGVEPPESCGEVRFVPASGAEERVLTEAFTTGEAVLLDEDGELQVCVGVWYSLLSVSAEVTVVGQEGALPEHVVLSGGETGTVVSVSGEGARVSLERVTLERGAARGEGNQQRGGGVRCEDAGSVELSEVIFRGNTAYDGGGLFAGQGCEVRGSGVVFEDNSTEDDGGAFRAEEATVVLADAVFTNNDGRDGGVMIAWESVVELTGATFEGNRSRDSQGGALLHYDGDLTVRNSVFEGNEALTVGGAIASFGDTWLEEVSFEANVSTGGGALYVYGDYGSLSCEGCSFAGNEPDDVGMESGGSGQSYVFEGESVDFVCSGSGCG